MVEVRGMPERDIGSLGAMGKGAGCGQEILPPPPPSPTHPYFNQIYMILIKHDIFYQECSKSWWLIHVIWKSWWLIHVIWKSWWLIHVKCRWYLNKYGVVRTRVALKPCCLWNEASFGPSKKMAQLTSLHIRAIFLLRPKDASFQGNAVSRQRGFEQRHIYLNIIYI